MLRVQVSNDSDVNFWPREMKVGSRIKINVNVILICVVTFVGESSLRFE